MGFTSVIPIYPVNVGVVFAAQAVVACRVPDQRGRSAQRAIVAAHQHPFLAISSIA
jgi:hypothetical protein